MRLKLKIVLAPIFAITLEGCIGAKSLDADVSISENATAQVQDIQFNPPYVAMVSDDATWGLHTFRVVPATRTITALQSFKVHQPSAARMNKAGTLAYVAYGANRNLLGYKVDPRTGLMEALPGFPFHVGQYMEDIGIVERPNGMANLYVFGSDAKTGYGLVRSLHIDAATGQLSLTGPDTILPEIKRLSRHAVHPNGRVLYSVSTQSSSSGTSLRYGLVGWTISDDNEWVRTSLDIPDAHGEVSKVSFDGSGSRLIIFHRNDSKIRVWDVNPASFALENPKEFTLDNFNLDPIGSDDGSWPKVLSGVIGTVAVGFRMGHDGSVRNIMRRTKRVGIPLPASILKTFQVDQSMDYILVRSTKNSKLGFYQLGDNQEISEDPVAEFTLPAMDSRACDPGRGVECSASCKVVFEDLSVD